MTKTWSSLLSATTISDVEKALAPPVSQRAQRQLEVEIETPEATFTLRYDKGMVTLAQRFATDPLLAMTLPASSLAWLTELVAVVMAQFPNAPAMNKWLEAMRLTTKTEAEAAVDAFKKLSAVAVTIDLVGVGKMTFARGAVEEASKTVVIKIEEKALRSLWQGASPATMRPTISGDRSVLANLATAFAPLLGRLRA